MVKPWACFSCHGFACVVLEVSLSCTVLFEAEALAFPDENMDSSHTGGKGKIPCWLLCSESRAGLGRAELCSTWKTRPQSPVSAPLASVVCAGLLF